MADVIFNSFKKKIMDGSIDLDTDELRVVLVTSTFTPDQDGHSCYVDIVNEVTGTGYTAEGTPLAGVTATQDDTDDEGVLDANDSIWSAAYITARAAVIYDAIATGSPLVCYMDFGEDIVATNAEFKITYAAEGLVNIG